MSTEQVEYYAEFIKSQRSREGKNKKNKKNKSDNTVDLESNLLASIGAEQNKYFYFLISVGQSYHKPEGIKAAVHLFSTLIKACVYIVEHADYFISLGRLDVVEKAKGKWKFVFLVGDKLQGYNNELPYPENDPRVIPEREKQSQEKFTGLAFRQKLWKKRGEEWVNETKEIIEELKSAGKGLITIEIETVPWEAALREAKSSYGFDKKLAFLRDSYKKKDSNFRAGVNIKGYRHLHKHTPGSGEFNPEAAKAKELPDSYLDYILEELALDRCLIEGMYFRESHQQLTFNPSEEKTSIKPRLNFVYPEHRDEGFDEGRALFNRTPVGHGNSICDSLFIEDWVALKVLKELQDPEFKKNYIDNNGYINADRLLGFSSEEKSANKQFQARQLLRALHLFAKKPLYRTEHGSPLHVFSSVGGMISADNNMKWDPQKPLVVREKLLEELRQKLHTDDQNPSVATLVKCQGMGGAGKTHLASYYFHQSDQTYLIKVWLTADNFDSLRNNLLNLAKQLCVVSLADDAQKYFREVIQGKTDDDFVEEFITIAKIIELLDKNTPNSLRMLDELYSLLQLKLVLKHCKNCLLVFDDVNDENVFTYITQFTKNIPGQIIFTTRRNSFQQAGMHIVKVGVMEQAEAVDLLAKRIHRFNKSEASREQEDLAVLANKLGYLPLALKIAGSYLAKYEEISISEYITEYDKNPITVMEDKEPIVSDFKAKAVATVATTYNMSIARIEKEDNDKRNKRASRARELLTVCAYLAPNNILEEILNGWLNESYPEEVKKEPELFRRLIAQLVEHALIEQDPQSTFISIHPVMQDILRASHKKVVKKNEVVEKNNHLKWFARLGVATAIVYENGHYTLQNKLLLPHVQAIKNYYGRNLKESAASVIFNFVLGSIQLESGKERQVREAGELFEELLPKAVEHFGEHQSMIGFLLMKLAFAYEQLEDITRMKATCEKALFVIESCPDKKPWLMAGSFAALGRAYGQLGDFSKMKELSEKALSVIKPYPEICIDTAVVIISLAKAKWNLENYAEAEELSKKVLPFIQSRFGNDHVYTGEALLTLALAHGGLGNIHKMEELSAKALPVMENHFGKESITVAHCLRYLAKEYLLLGNFDKAKDLSGKALSILKYYDRKEGKSVFISTGILAAAHLALENAVEVIELLKNILPFVKSFFGEAHIKVAHVLGLLGLAYNNLGDFNSAERVLTQAVEIIEFNYNEGCKDYLIAALWPLANTYQNLGDIAKEKELLERVLPLMLLSNEKKSKNMDKGFKRGWDISIVLIHLAEAYEKLGDNAKARESLKQALPIVEFDYGKRHGFVAYLLNEIASLSGYLGDMNEKKIFLEKALKIMIFNHGEKSIAAANIFLKLAYVNRALENFRQAYFLAKSALAIFRLELPRNLFFTWEPTCLMKSMKREWRNSIREFVTMRISAASLSTQGLFKLDFTRRSNHTQNVRRFTGLHALVQQGRSKDVRYFLERNACYSVMDQRGKTPIDIAIEKNDEVMLSVLEKFIINKYRNSQIIVMSGDLEALKLLIYCSKKSSTFSPPCFSKIMLHYFSP